jgi:hypothetical protein
LKIEKKSCSDWDIYVQGKTYLVGKAGNVTCKKKGTAGLLDSLSWGRQILRGGREPLSAASAPVFTNNYEF